MSNNTAAGLSNPNFYVVTATVIPVLFLGLVLQGELWKWIADKIAKGTNTTNAERVLVSSLQLLAILILAAGILSEGLAIYALWRQSAGAFIEGFIFFSVLFLILLLGIALAAKIPGFSESDPMRLPPPHLAFGEKISWSGYADRFTLTAFLPWVTGRLDLTDRRLVWITNKELGLRGAPPVEIRSEELKSLTSNIKSAKLGKMIAFSWALVPGSVYLFRSLFPPIFLSINVLVGPVLRVTTTDGKPYNLRVDANEYSKAEQYLKALIMPSAPQEL